jgi:hypothetical protein
MTSRKALPAAVRRAVLAEAGYRCAVPTCRGILALDLHHMEEVSEGGSDTVDNLIALCPTCHALYTRGTISRDAIYTYKSVLVSLNAAFDREAVSNLLFLRIASDRQDLLMSGDGLLRFTPLISAGYADYRMVANNADQLYSYTAWLTDRGRLLLEAWLGGDRGTIEQLLGGPSVPDDEHDIG